MKRFKMPETLSQQINDFEPLNSLVLSSDIFDKNLIILIDQSNIVEVIKILKDEDKFSFTNL